MHGEKKESIPAIKETIKVGEESINMLSSPRPDTKKKLETFAKLSVKTKIPKIISKTPAIKLNNFKWGESFSIKEVVWEINKPASKKGTLKPSE